MTGQPPDRRTKLIFWILLGLSSTYFAEVTVGNLLFPFFTPFALLIAVPLYALHILVLSAYVVRDRDVSLRVLFFAGMLFGLYEAYITKIIWAPTWSFVGDFRAFGIAVPQTTLLMLWYHNFFAFIIPLGICELMCTRSSRILDSMPTRIRNMFSRHRLMKTVILAGVVFGLVESVVSESPLVALASVLSGAAVIALAMYYVRDVRGSHRFTLDEMLPDRRQSKKLLMVLLVFYAVMTPLLLPEKLPGLWPQITVWALYAVAFTFLYFTLGERIPHAASSQELPREMPMRERVFRWRMWWLFIGVYAAVAAVMSLGLQVLSAVFTLFFHVAGVSLGIFIICSTALWLAKGGRHRVLEKGRVNRAVTEAKRLLAEHGYECQATAEDMVLWFQADTPFDEDSGLDEVITRPLIVVHELVEIDDVKRMGIALTKNAIVDNIEKVDDAHLKAAETELQIAASMRDTKHLRWRLEHIKMWSEDPSVTSSNKERYEELSAKVTKTIEDLEGSETR